MWTPWSRWTGLQKSWRQPSSSGVDVMLWVQKQRAGRMCVQISSSVATRTELLLCQCVEANV